MPFSSAFLVNNVLVPEAELSLIFLVTGLVSMVTGPLLGRFTDMIGKFRMFFTGSVLSIAMVLVYTRLGPNPVWVVMVVNTILWLGISSRMISSAALISGVPDLADRGAYMGINSAVQQVSGGVAAFIAGLIVHQPAKSAPLQHYDIVGYLTVCSMLFTLVMMFVIDRQVAKKLHVAKV
jgi:predicted MFS family arabinose efflux permease